MKRIAAVFAATLFVAIFAGKVFAADAAAPKFGYVDFQRAVAEVEDGKKAKGVLDSEFNQRQKQLDAAQNELQTMKTDLDKQRMILSADALRDKEETFKKKYIEFQQKFAGFNEELGAKRAKMMNDIFSGLKGVVNVIGSKDGYTMILEKSQDVVLFSQGGSDLTDQVIKNYNALSKSDKDKYVKEFAPKGAK